MRQLAAVRCSQLQLVGLSNFRHVSAVTHLPQCGYLFPFSNRGEEVGSQGET